MLGLGHSAGELIEKHSGLGRVPDDTLLYQDVLGLLVHVIVYASYVRSHDSLHRLVLSLFKQVWPESIDHDFIMQGLIVEFFVERAIVFMDLPLLAIDLL